ncbi:Drug/metabolite transporter [Niveomyces insectorum RCEF 264]|uniref:Drug/metabolite transporter n=1 Tax=Niveomyces insectorum RCEF 264 TaxID=1081102 RepID=A0A167Y510_9HYPO|nr:Drug/metabolite transporter [Niveomyces insectorum RCEF 264]
MFRPADGRSGTPLLHGYAATADSTPILSASDSDRGRSGTRTPRRFDDSGGSGGGGGAAAVLEAALPPYSPAAIAASFERPVFAPVPAPALLSRRNSSFRSRSPAAHARLAARRKYAYASCFLVLSLISFTAQTELAAWVQHAGWDKAYCMLYLTHGSWALLWPVQLLVLRLQKRSVPWPAFWRRHVWLLQTTAVMVETRSLDVVIPPPPAHIHAHTHTPTLRSILDLRSLFAGGANSRHTTYLLRTTAFVTCSLTVAGLSWYIAVSMTSPSDLTAIYNCSAFFAYAFSVPLLHERLRADKAFAVLVAVAGVLVVAYGDAGHGTPSGEHESGDESGGKRLLGNLIIGVGSVLYGLYEVLYKRFACPPDGCSPGRGMIFANTFGSCIGLFTLTVLWVPLPVLHLLGIETFVLPTGKVAWYLFLSVAMNATFAGSFLVLISLTSPVLSSVASLLTIFIVAVSDWWLTGQPPSGAALLGGSMIVLAFGLLSWSTYKEMTEEEQRKEVDLSGDDDDSSGREDD